MRAAILTLSDKGARGERVDASGPALSAWLAERGVTTVAAEVIADEYQQIIARLTAWADSDTADLILTTGGTGVSPRDVTPEATMQVVTRLIPGMAELMRLRSMEKTRMAALSRAVVGIRAQSLIINLPGSPKGAVENLEAVWQVIGHAVEKIRGDSSDCGERFTL
ncbi:MogA/MoaB family molybdenum cofactor biosynthesis protein [Trichlorobacter lovleyi]|uniref:Molybdopterin adenylyltransferase n=1 Tax=Trichlorobacter lovleyi (strain ATCC BAA-1151 / DSM 17278 / SZ) TaxID=398767 RepID=B3E5H9_TRIL1|nr:MogA/MoaB family molybdenum cofactor biosynthesis protein [Trichlorobacter lovleyi]ACD94650.1 molybdenum cofactor synthesis domain protein [Trichlorobacter lovleyi SZ]